MQLSQPLLMLLVKNPISKMAQGCDTGCSSQGAGAGAFPCTGAQGGDVSPPSTSFIQEVPNSLQTSPMSSCPQEGCDSAGGSWLLALSHSDWLISLPRLPLYQMQLSRISFLSLLRDRS